MEEEGRSWARGKDDVWSRRRMSGFSTDCCLQGQVGVVARGATVNYIPMWEKLEAFTPATLDVIPVVFRNAVAGVVTVKHWECIMATINKCRETVH